MNAVRAVYENVEVRGVEVGRKSVAGGAFRIVDGRLKCEGWYCRCWSASGSEAALAILSVKNSGDGLRPAFLTSLVKFKALAPLAYLE